MLVVEHRFLGDLDHIEPCEVSSTLFSTSAPCAEVAQLVEHSPEKAGVDSSILSLGTMFRLLRDRST
jgi:hypothetical protein